MMDPRQVLGVAASATEEDIRAAYLLKVKEHPPDRSPVSSSRFVTPMRCCETHAGVHATCCCRPIPERPSRRFLLTTPRRASSPDRSPGWRC